MGAARRALPALIFALLCAAARAQTSDPAIERVPEHPEAEAGGPPSTLSFSQGREWLDNDSPDWTESILRYQYRFAKNHFIEVGAAQTERFDLDDTRLMAMYGVPLDKEWHATLETEWSDTHRVLPKTLYGATLQYEFAKAWLVSGGMRTTRYDDVRVNQGLLMLEHYFGDYSAAFAWRPAHAFGTDANSYEVRGAYYYSDVSSVGVSYSDGEEVTNLGTSIVIADVRGFALVGKHAFEPGPWALRYALSHVKQGDFYTRRGITIGVEYAF